MELYEPLPLNLRSSFKEGITPAIRQQLEFLWRGAHATSSSTSLSHSLARKFIELGIKSGLQIPEQVKNRLCNYCSAVLLPTITSTIRVQSRGKDSRIHKLKNLIPRVDTNSDPECSVVFDAKVRRKLKNQVVSDTTFFMSYIPKIFLSPSFHSLLIFHFILSLLLTLQVYLYLPP